MNIIEFTPGMIPEAGNCYSGMSNDDYHNTFIEWFCSSDLKNALRSVEYFWQEYTRKKNLEEKEYKIHFEVGQAHHESIQSIATFGDMRLFDENVISYEGKAMSKEFKRIKALNPQKAVIPIETFENLPIMVEKTMDAAEELNIFHEGEFELAFFWIDPETGIKVKCKTDYTRFDVKKLFDFKTTKDHREKEFSKDLANYGYHFSGAVYLDGIKQVTGVEMDRLIFITTNNTKPFEVEFYPLNQVSLDQGEAMYRQVLTDLSLNKPPEPKFKTIGVPFWALTKIEKEYRR